MIGSLSFSFGYAPNDGEACLMIRRQDSRIAFAIRQRDAWRFSRDHQEQVEVQHDSGIITYIDAVDARMVDLTQQIVDHLFPGDVIPDGHRRAAFCASLMSAVEDRLDDLVKMPPQPEEERRVIGEAVVSANGGREMSCEIMG